MKNFLFQCTMVISMCCGIVIGVIIAPSIVLAVLQFSKWLSGG